MTVTEFLAARLAEDEFEAGQVMCEWHDNDKRLRQVTAMRAILAAVEQGCIDSESHYTHVRVSRELAAIWSDHEQYDEAWKL